MLTSSMKIWLKKEFSNLLQEKYTANSYDGWKTFFASSFFKLSH